MSLPSSVSTGVLTWDISDLAADGAGGLVLEVLAGASATFVAGAPSLADSTSGKLILPKPIGPVPLSQGQQELALTDTNAVNPQAWTWSMVTTLPGGLVLAPVVFALPASALDGSGKARLVDLAPVSTSGGVLTTRGPEGPAGVGAPPAGTTDGYIAKSVSDSAVWFDGTTVFATAAQLAAVIVGLKYMQVAAVATTNVATLSGLPTVDGDALTAGQLVLLTAQTTGSQNGPWTVGTGAWTRPAKYAAGQDAAGTSIFVEAGTNYGTSTWVVTGDGPYVIGTDATTWQQTSGLAQVIPGTALSKSGNTLNVSIGTSAGTAAAGDDARITGAAQKASNLSDLANLATALGNLGGVAATDSRLAPAPTVANAGKVVTVKADGSGYELDAGGGALTSATGRLATAVALSATIATILTVSLPAAGTWLVTANVALQMNNTGTNGMTIKAVAGTGSPTIAGTDAVPVFLDYATISYAMASFTFLATCTAAATVLIQGQAASAATSAVVSCGSFSGGTHETGWTTVKIA